MANPLDTGQAISAALQTYHQDNALSRSHQIHRHLQHQQIQQQQQLIAVSNTTAQAHGYNSGLLDSGLTLSWEIAWKHKKVKEWSSEDVMAWFLYVIEDQEGKDIVESKLHNFNLKGLTLMCMTEYEFIARDPLYGQTLYRDLQKRLREEREASRPWSMDSWVPYLCHSLRCARSPPPTPINDEDREPLPTAVRSLPEYPEFPANWDSMWMNTSIYEWTERDVIAWVIYVLEKENLPTDNIDLTRFKCSGEDLLRMSKEDFKERSPNYGQKLYEAWFCKKYEDYTTQFKEKREETPSFGPISQETEYSSSHSGVLYYKILFDRQESLKVQLTESTLEGSDSEDSMDDPPKMQYWKPRKRAGGHTRLWPFLRDLLKSGKNSDVIDWVHREKGIFKIRDTKKLAELWGERRNNPNMNYEKMYSSLRYNYKSGYMRRVPGQKLVFGFGPYAKGWKYYEDSSVVPENNKAGFTSRLPSFL